MTKLSKCKSGSSRRALLNSISGSAQPSPSPTQFPKSGFSQKTPAKPSPVTRTGKAVEKSQPFLSPVPDSAAQPCSHLSVLRKPQPAQPSPVYHFYRKAVGKPSPTQPFPSPAQPRPRQPSQPSPVPKGKPSPRFQPSPASRLTNSKPKFKKKTCQNFRTKRFAQNVFGTQTLDNFYKP